MEARIAVAFIYLLTADGPHVARIAYARVRINPILTFTMVARIRIAVVDVLRTQSASKTCGTLALVAIGMVDTFGSIETGRAGAVIYINLTHSTTESRRTDTEEPVDFIETFSIIHTWIT